MRKIILTLLCVMTFSALHAQSNEDIANVYIKRANAVIEESIDYKEAKVLFYKAMKYMDTITSSKIAKLGARIHYELDDFKEAKGFFEQYFALVKNKKSEDYAEQVDLFVTTEEALQLQIAEEKRLEEERIAKEKELRRIDSLKTVWSNKSDQLSLKVDSIYAFDKNKLGIYQSNSNFGIIDDKGAIVLNADTYKTAKSFDGYIVLTDKKNEPTKVYVYNTNTKNGFSIPSVSDFNPLATHYGKVMLPRGNGRLVLYPNNSLKAMVYDLEEKKRVQVANEKELFKSLRKTDKIDKSNKEGQVKLNKEWYNFGGHIGGGIYPLYNTDYSIYGYLCSIDGKIVKSTKYSHLGTFYNNKSQALEGSNTVWVNQNGTKVDAPTNESGTYKGTTKIVKLENGNYQMLQDGIIILGDKKLEKMADFLRANNQ